MGWEANVPTDFWPKVQKMIDNSIAKALRAGPLQNSSISGGAGLTIKDDGALRLETSDGVTSFYVGPVLPAKADGTGQQGLILRREDGTIAMALFDTNPTDAFRQFLALYDRAGNIIMSDDTESGQGLARPYVGAPFYPARFNDVTVSSVSPTFETLWRAILFKQQPQLYVGVSGGMDTAGTTGEVRVMVNGVQMGTTQAMSSTLAALTFGPAPVAGAHMDQLAVEIQGRITSASGALKVAPSLLSGWQS